MKKQSSFPDHSRWQNHVDKCNDALWGGPFVDILLQGHSIGRVTREKDKLLTENYRKKWNLCASVKEFEDLVDFLVNSKQIVLRNETLDIRSQFGGRVLATADRSVFPVLGLLSEGAHLNGLVRTQHGTSVWIGKRSPKLLSAPGKLDQLAGGVVQAGSSPRETVHREAWEEAEVPKKLMAGAIFTGSVKYQKMWEDGMSRDCIYCYDVWLPRSFKPVPRDGEMTSFELWPVEDVAERVYQSDDFKFNVNLVLIELFKREGLNLTGVS